MATGVGETFHINVIIDKTKLEKSFSNLIKEFRNMARGFKTHGMDGSDFSRTAERFRSRLRRLDKSLQRELESIGGELIDEIVQRYLSFIKLDGRPVGRTGALESALRDASQNLKVSVDVNFAKLGVMNRDYLTGSTPTTTDTPYYIYQNQFITPGGPRYHRFFITEVTLAGEQIHEEDRVLIEERISNLIEKILSEERMR